MPDMTPMYGLVPGMLLHVGLCRGGCAHKPPCLLRTSSTAAEPRRLAEQRRHALPEWRQQAVAVAGAALCAKIREGDGGRARHARPYRRAEEPRACYRLGANGLQLGRLVQGAWLCMMSVVYVQAQDAE